MLGTSTSPALNPNTYRWAETADECAAQMFRARDKYRNSLKAGEMFSRWLRAHRCYHAFSDGQSGDGSFLGRRGSKGQRAVTRNSRTATDARHAISIISQAVPAIDAIPANTAPATLAQVGLVKKLFDYYMERRQLARQYYAGAVSSFKFGISWIFFDWDIFAGLPLETPERFGSLPQELQDPSTGQLAQGATDSRMERQTTGDVWFRTRSPLETVIDLQQTGPHDWMMVADPFNRWELIARYPMFADDIKKLPSVADDEDAKWMTDFRVTGADRASDSDLVRVWTLFHKKCRALPQGRMLTAVSSDRWLFEGPLPYDEIPSVELVAGDRIDGTPWFDSPIFHATGTQAAIDRALSAWITNILATGHQLISITDPTFEMKELSDGVSAIVNKPGPAGSEPRGISLTAPQVEQERLVESLKHDVDGTFATNSVIRGEPDANIRSGAFAGLMVQQAITFLNPAQYSFQRGVEQGGNHLLAILKRFADKPLIAELAGPGGEWRQQAFSQQDISGIHRIYAKPANPATQTAAFRKSVADELLERGLIKTPAEYLAMIATNQPSLADEGAETKLINILQENEEMLRSAKSVGPMQAPLPPVMVLITDDDPLHIRKHAELLDSPSARTDPVLAKIVTEHIMAHYQQALTKPPPLALMLGQPSAAAPMLPPPGKPGEGGPSGAPAAPAAPAPVHPAAKAAAPEHRPPPAAGP